MESRLPGFHGEYLWEADIARMQLLALAEVAPEEMYGWSPAAGARSFSAVLVHIAAVNAGLLRLAGLPAGLCDQLYGEPQTDVQARIASMIRANVSLERTVTSKENVIALLRRSFEAVEQTFRALSTEELELPEEFFDEPTTKRRLYLRALAHSHEHMGQAIAYARTYGIRVPWPDPLNEYASEAGAGVSR